MHGMQQTQKIRLVRIIKAIKFVTYLKAIFELRNANFLPILSPYGTFHCKLVPSRNRAILLSLNYVYFWFTCNEIDFSEVTQILNSKFIWSEATILFFGYLCGYNPIVTSKCCFLFKNHKRFLAIFI